MFEVIDIDISINGEKTSANATGYFMNLKNHKFFAQGKRPVVIVCPGGGYKSLTETESEPIAMQYIASGCSAVVLNYTVGPASFPKQFIELAKLVLFLRENSEKLGIDPDNIVVQGSSAGGHLAVAYAELWNSGHINKFLNLPESEKESLKINGIILAYAGILYGDWIENLLGEEYKDFKDLMQLENHVFEGFPRSFIWQTLEDQCVPIPHSLKLVNSICEKNASVEYHIFPRGNHAMSVAKPFLRNVAPETPFPVNVSLWVQMSCNWVWDKYSD